MDEKEIYHLLELYSNSSLSEEEKKRLEQWIAASEDNKQLFDRLTDSRYLADELQKLYTYSEERGWKRIAQHLPKTDAGHQFSRSAFSPWHWIVAACVAGLILCISIFFPGKREIVQKSITTKPAIRKDVAAPLSTKAFITLANGKTVALDSIREGTLASQGNMKVTKNRQGEISYAGTAMEMLYNTIVNPNGSRVVSMILQDGSRIWLNNGSSLRYPVAFLGNERRVEITGEAYFEVAGDRSRKFVVSVNGITAEVLGTRFNVNAYDDEAETQVTLLTGKVRVSSPFSENVLRPGQQAAIVNGNGKMSVQSFNEDRVMAWHTGVFYFEDNDLPSVMRQLARWYDVEVRYLGKIAPDRYSGVISRDLSLFAVLKIMKIAGVKYTLQGNQVLIESNR